MVRLALFPGPFPLRDPRVAVKCCSPSGHPILLLKMVPLYPSRPLFRSSGFSGRDWGREQQGDKLHTSPCSFIGQEAVT
ncbi:hypothetical protein O3P69_012720 [Scylla paramamosain]|uniref:Uncharacterized protein n=1 Tax=Scylla paramamosain TaxID=85552 RepID=A0AAW0SC64_SCYPA